MSPKDNFLRLFWSLEKLRTIFEVGFRTMEKLQNSPFEDKLNMRSKDNFLRLFWSLDMLRTIFEVGIRTLEKLEATGLASKFSI